MIDDVLARPKAQAILEAARRLFLAQGLQVASVDAIAREAGVSKATLYGYFASKEALFSAVAEAQCRQHAEFIVALDAETSDIRAALSAFGVGLLTFMMAPDNVAIFRQIVAEAARSPDIGRAFYEAGPVSGLRRLAAFFDRAQQKGRLRKSDPAVMADHFMAIMKGGLHLRALFSVGDLPGPDEIGAHVAAAVDAFMRAYATPAAAPAKAQA